MKKATMAVSLMVVSLLALAACGGGRVANVGISGPATTTFTLESQEVLELVPQDSAMIVTVKIQEILADPHLQKLANQFLQEEGGDEAGSEGSGSESDSGSEDAESMGGLVEEAQREFGVDLREIEEIIAFFPSSFFDEDDDSGESSSGDGNGSSSDGSDNGSDMPNATMDALDETSDGGVFFHGEFDQDEVLAALQRQTEEELNSSTYNGQEIYLNPDEEEGGAVAFLADDVLLVGSEASVKAAIDVFQGDAEGISGEALEALEELGDHFFKLYIDVPEGAFDNMAGEPGAEDGGMDPSVIIQGIQTVTASLGSEEAGDGSGRLILDVAVSYSSAEAADRGHQALIGFMGLLNAFGDQEMRDVLAGLEASLEDSTVMIQFLFDPEELAMQLGSFMSMGEDSGVEE